MVGSGVLGQDVGLTELFPVSPQVMENRQMSRSPRVRLLLLLLLLLVPWGDRTASGVALPPARVLRYARRPGHPGRGGDSDRWDQTQGERGTERRRMERWRTEGRTETRTETRGGERWSREQESARGRGTRRF